MKHKKLIALLAASVMAMSSMTVMAAEGVIDGNVNYVDKTIYKVVLPTTEGMSFTLDPQGLSSLDDDGVYSDTEVGKIVSTTSMVAKNLSSVELVLTADFSLEDSSTSDAASFVASIDDPTAKQVALVINTSDTTTQTVSVTDTASGSTFTMKEATYNFELDANGEYAYVMEEGSGSELTMSIGGEVAKDADWSAYVGEGAQTITLNAVFKFTDANANDYELKDDDIVADDAVVPATDDYVMTLNAEDGSVSYTFLEVPEGTLTALTTDGTSRATAISKGNITYADGKLTFTATAVANTLTTGTNTIVATIGDTDYTLTYVAE